MGQRTVSRGLRPTPYDERDMKLGALYTLPDVASLPDEFILPHFIYDQKDTDFCSACTTCQMSYAQEGMPLSPEFSFAMSKELSGDVDEWGQDLRTACKAHTKIGALTRAFSPYTFESSDGDFMRCPENWNNQRLLFEDDIRGHRKKSYFKVVGPYDHFDDIRASIFKFQSAVGTGIDWDWQMSKEVIENIPQGGSGHAMAIVGWTPGYLLYAQSYGKDAGKDGLVKVSREVVNHFVGIYGAYMFVDIPREDAQYHLEVGTSPEWPWLKQLLMAFKNVILNRQ